MTDGETMTQTEALQTPGRAFLPAMILSYVVQLLPTGILAVTLLKIGSTFGVSEAATAQLNTATSLVAVFTALLMGAWSVRYPHRSLLLTGLLLTILGAAGSFLAPNFLILLLCFALLGWGVGMINPMPFALIGAHIPLARRSHALGWLYSGFAIITSLGSLIVAFIVETGGDDGWRWPFLGFLLPMALLSLGLILKGVPTPVQDRPRDSTSVYWAGFQGIFTNRSATVCLSVNMLANTGAPAVLLFSVSFLQIHFNVSLEGATMLVWVVGVLIFAVGSHLGGQIVPRFGRKPVTVVTTFLFGLFVSAFMLSPTLGLVMGFTFLADLFAGVQVTAVSSLTLEQVPRFRGSMMSLNSAVIALGNALGTMIGGLALLWWNFEGVGLTLGALSLVAALLYHFLVVDPTNEPHMKG